MTITEKDIDRLEIAFQTANDKQNVTMMAMFNEHMSGDHHKFLEAWIAKEDRNNERWEKLKGNFIFWLVTGITGAIGIWIWNSFFDIKHF